MGWKDKTYVMQGFGNVGFHSARYFSRMVSQLCLAFVTQYINITNDKGAKCIGIAEWDGDIYNANGIDIKALEDYKIANGTIVGFPGAEAWDSKANGPLIEIKCDILGACAKEKVNLLIRLYGTQYFLGYHC